MSGISLSLSVNSVSSLEWVRLDFLEDCREELISACRESSPLSKKKHKNIQYSAVEPEPQEPELFALAETEAESECILDPVPDLV
jgi:hypothetical protein